MAKCRQVTANTLDRRKSCSKANCGTVSLHDMIVLSVSEILLHVDMVK